MPVRQNLAFVNCNVIDGDIDSEVIQDAVILVRNRVEDEGKAGRIEAVAGKEDVEIPPGYRVIDLEGKYVMPGLINAHAHLIGSGKPRNTRTPAARRRLAEFLGTRVGRAIALKWIRQNARNALHAGVTTVRTVGDPHAYSIPIRREVEDGRMIGPRILAAGKIIASSGGHGADFLAYVADSPWEARKAVRKAIQDGADFIKIASTGGVSDSERIGEAGRPEMTLEEISAACDEAHRAGLKVASHVHSTFGVREALLGGVDTVEHGADLNDDLIRLFKNNPRSLMGYSALVPTLSVIINVTDHDTRYTRFTPVQYENGTIIRDRMINAFRKGLEGGVKIGVGNDAGVVLTPHYDVWKELLHFVEYGNMTPRQAIFHATKCNAEILGIDNVTGTIKAGKSADFVVLEEDPTENLALLSKPSMVVVFGHVIENPTVRRVREVDAASHGESKSMGCVNRSPSGVTHPPRMKNPVL